MGAVIGINQDPLGVQARKLAIDGKPLPWLVGLESCAGRGPVDFYSRGLEQGITSDTRSWSTIPVGIANQTYLLKSDATNRCLQAVNWSSVSSLPMSGDASMTVGLLP